MCVGPGVCGEGRLNKGGVVVSGGGTIGEEPWGMCSVSIGRIACKRKQPSPEGITGKQGKVCKMSCKGVGWQCVCVEMQEPHSVCRQVVKVLQCTTKGKCATQDRGQGREEGMACR